ncbi:MAG TPA: hypothetical protein VFP21_03890 [Solirubrobacterales bacterium]|nr:hypothetical protein [Solirubrobacterales bacterium]
MSTIKIRTAVTVFVAALSFAVAAVAPAVSQAQWHTIVVGGHVFTHGNFTEGGVSPCTRIEGEIGKAEGAVGDDKDWIGRHDAGEATAKAGLAEAEGEVNRASGEAFEYGCDTVAGAARSSHGSGTHRATHVNSARS